MDMIRQVAAERAAYIFKRNAAPPIFPRHTAVFGPNPWDDGSSSLDLGGRHLNCTKTH